MELSRNSGKKTAGGATSRGGPTHQEGRRDILGRALSSYRRQKKGESYGQYLGSGQVFRDEKLSHKEKAFVAE